MNQKEHAKTDRRSASEKDIKDALESVLLAPRTNVRSENREPTKKEISKRYRLDRR